MSHRTVMQLLVALTAGSGILLTPAPSAVAAATAVPDRVFGTTIVTESSLCNPSASARTDVAVVSPGPRPRVGQTFHLLLTVVGVNACLQQQQAGLHIKLPVGVEVDTAGQSGCLMFRSGAPGAVTTVSCRRSPVGKGFERVDPATGTSWTLIPGGVDSVQIQLAVRATTTGPKTFSGRVCDSGSTFVCQGKLPLANAIPLVGFTVIEGFRPVTPERLYMFVREHLRNPVAPGVTPSNAISVSAMMFGSRPQGIWEIQRRGPGASDFTTIAERAIAEGAAPPIFEMTATGLSPGTTHRFRACYVPSGGTRVCGTRVKEGRTRAR